MGYGLGSPRQADASQAMNLYLAWGLLGGSGDLVSRLIRGIVRVTMWVIGVINLLTKSP